MRWKKQSHTKRAMAVIVLFLGISIVATAGLSYFITTDHLETEVEQVNRSLLREVNGKLLLVLKGIDTEAIQFLRSRDMWGFMEDDSDVQNNAIAINARITDILMSNDAIFSIDLYSYAKDRRSWSNLFQQLAQSSDYRWLDDFKNYKGFYQWIGTRKLSIDDTGAIQHNVVTLLRSYPLTHAEGYRKGVVSVNIDEVTIYHLIGSAIEPSLGYLFIADGSGTIISHADKSRIGTKADASFWGKGPDKQTEGRFRIRENGAGQTVFFTTNAYTGWKIVSVVSDVALNKPLVSVRNTMLGISLLLLLLAAGMAVVVGRWTFRPINRLLAGVSRQLQSHRTYRDKHEDGPRDEFGRIERSLSHLLADSDRMHRHMRETQPMVKWRLAMDALTGARTTPGELLQSLDAIGSPLHASQFVVMAAEFDRRAEIASAHDLQLYCYALGNVAEEMINAENRGMAIEAREGLVVIIVSFADNDGDGNQLRAFAVAELIKSFVQEHFKRTISLGVGRLAHGIGELQTSYHDALSALSYKLILGENTIISGDDIREPAGGEFLRLIGATDGILDSLRLLDREKMKKQTARWFGIMTEGRAAPDLIRQAVVQFMMKAAGAVAEIDPALLDEVPSHRLFDLLSQYESIRELAEFVSEQLDRYADRIEARRSARESSGVVERIIAFIDTHYMHSDLSLNYLAGEFKMSVSYLSRLFKEHTEGNFIDYLMDIRIARAKEMLAASDMLIRDVSEAVGYSNANSFVRIFKKSTGLTPGEFRERERGMGAGPGAGPSGK